MTIRWCSTTVLLLSLLLLPLPRLSRKKKNTNQYKKKTIRKSHYLKPLLCKITVRRNRQRDFLLIKFWHTEFPNYSFFLAYTPTKSSEKNKVRVQAKFSGPATCSKVYEFRCKFGHHFAVMQQFPFSYTTFLR